MCMKKSCSPRLSIGDMSAAAVTAMPARKRASRSGDSPVACHRLAYQIVIAPRSTSGPGAIVHDVSGAIDYNV